MDTSPQDCVHVEADKGKLYWIVCLCVNVPCPIPDEHHHTNGAFANKSVFRKLISKQPEEIIYE
jgi:hypothetical protein